MAEAPYRCGTLVYTRAGLFTLFSWLLWGDFCFSLMENIWPNILPLMLKAEGTPNTLLSLVITTIPSAMNFGLNPIISTVSDRYRGRRGRRIPFLLAATPFVTVCLVLLGFSRDLGKGLHAMLAAEFPELSAAMVTIGMIAVLVVCFRFFELFVNTVFWYLFNDVVPPTFMGRFLGFFRVVGSVAGAAFNFFLFPYAESHTALIFFGVAALYGTVFLLMTLNVKEGEYPPPDQVRRNPFGWMRIFFKECLAHRIYRLVFTCSAWMALSNAIRTFAIFMAFSIGLDKGDVGKVAGTAALLSVVIMYPMGALVDRYHPVRIMLATKLAFCVVTAVNFIFLFRDFDRVTAFWIYAATTALAIPIHTATTAASLPMLMHLFPRAKFGQFCSANAMCTALGTMVGGVLAGAFLDALKPMWAESEFFYRFVPVWQVLLMLPALGTMVMVYREWKKLGGDEGYRPPLADWKDRDFIPAISTKVR